MICVLRIVQWLFLLFPNDVLITQIWISHSAVHFMFFGHTLLELCVCAVHIDVAITLGVPPTCYSKSGSWFNLIIGIYVVYGRACISCFVIFSLILSFPLILCLQEDLG